MCQDGYNDVFDMKDTKVACRQLGFNSTVGYWLDARGTGRIWLFNMRCSGSESSFGRYTNNGWGNAHSRCNSHTEDVGVLGYVSELDTK